MSISWQQCALFAIKVFLFLYDILTIPVYLILHTPWKLGQEAKVIRSRVIKSEREAVTYRTNDPPRAVHVRMLQENIDTLEKVFTYVAKTYPTKNCLGTRQKFSEEDELQPNGRVFKKYNLGEYKWKTYQESERMATSFGRGLRQLGHRPYQKIVIFAETRFEWMIAAHACFKHSMPIVTVYATLGDDGIVHCINETEVSTVITSYELLPKVIELLSKCPNVTNIVYMEDQLQRSEPANCKDNDRVTIVPFMKVFKKGACSRCENVPPKSDDTAIIMYTSGSTGTPKGVLLSHKNCIATMKGFCDMVPLFPEDILIAFLPLAHVFELLAECVCFMTGMSIGYSSPLTITDTGGKIKRGCKGDARVLNPTCMTAVPLILDRIAKGIKDKINESNDFHKQLFEYFYGYKIKWLNRGFRTPLLDLVVFRKASSLMGGHMRLILSGGAPLSASTHEYVQTCLCLKVVQGYGLTETTSSGTVMSRMDMTYGRTGGPLTVCDIRLINWEDALYNINNKPFPQGEIIIGGDCVSQGYYKMPSKTSEDFFEEDGRRWFRTGDIGEMHADGALKVIDRKKDLVKLQAGEYVSLGKIETELKTCNLIDNICVYADPSKEYVVALIVPNKPQIMQLAARSSLGRLSFSELCASPVMKAAILQEMQKHASHSKLQKLEIPVDITLCDEIWSPESDLVTAAFKLKRKNIQAKYQADIDRMYGS